MVSVMIISGMMMIQVNMISVIMIYVMNDGFDDDDLNDYDHYYKLALDENDEK